MAEWPPLSQHITGFSLICVQKHVMPCYSKCGPRTSSTGQGKQSLGRGSSVPHPAVGSVPEGLGLRVSLTLRPHDTVTGSQVLFSGVR